jgi:hypothetical protein
MDPLKHKESVRKMLEEERKKKEERRYRLRFLRGAREKKLATFRAPEEMGGIPHEHPEKNAQGGSSPSADDLPWWING